MAGDGAHKLARQMRTIRRTHSTIVPLTCPSVLNFTVGGHAEFPVPCQESMGCSVIWDLLAWIICRRGIKVIGHDRISSLKEGWARSAGELKIFPEGWSLACVRELMHMNPAYIHCRFVTSNRQQVYGLHILHVKSSSNNKSWPRFLWAANQNDQN
jgi:hypothetical protein